MSNLTILTENFAGMKSQAIGFAQRAGFNEELCYLTPKFPWKIISAPYWPMPLKSVLPFRLSNSPIIVSVGSVGGVINASLRNTNRMAIHIQNPRIALSKFDLIIANPHDGISASNVLISRTALHHVTIELLKKNKTKWESILHPTPIPLVSVLLGGNNGRFKFGKKEAYHLANQLKSLMINDNISLAITPSRRTDPEVVQIIQNTLQPLGAYIWNGQGENPYLGLLACADFILVTMDSVSMISEAVATSVPVMILPLPGKSKRIFSFIHSMQQENRVKIFKGKLINWSVKPLDDTDEIINKVKIKLNL